RGPVRALPAATRHRVAAFRALPGAQRGGRAGGEMDRGSEATRCRQPADGERERPMSSPRAAIVAWLLLGAARAAAQEGPADDASAADEPLPAVDTSATSGATDEIVLERSEITGNRELPKVLYIVPW